MSVLNDKLGIRLLDNDLSPGTFKRLADPIHSTRALYISVKQRASAPNATAEIRCCELAGCDRSGKISPHHLAHTRTPDTLTFDDNLIEYPRIRIQAAMLQRRPCILGRLIRRHALPCLSALNNDNRAARRRGRTGDSAEPLRLRAWPGDRDGNGDD